MALLSVHLEIWQSNTLFRNADKNIHPTIPVALGLAGDLVAARGQTSELNIKNSEFPEFRGHLEFRGHFT